MTEYFVYILSNASGMLYVGLTTDLPSMLQKHRLQNVQSFKANFAFNKLEYVEQLSNPEAAVCRFHTLKGMNMREKRELITTSNTQELSERDLGIKQIAWACIFTGIYNLFFSTSALLRILIFLERDASITLYE